MSLAFKAGQGPNIAIQWKQVKAELAETKGNTEVNHWLNEIIVVCVRGGTVRLSVPTQFKRDVVNERYKNDLERIWQRLNSRVVDIELIATKGAQSSVRTDMAGGNVLSATPSIGFAGGAAGRSTPPSFPDLALTGAAPDKDGFDDRFTFESFVVGPQNAFAHAVAQRLAEANRLPFNLAYIYGGTGLGKSHLLYAVAWEIRNRDPERVVRYMSADKFLREFVRNVRASTMESFKDDIRKADVLIIDDLHMIQGANAQEELRQTLDALLHENKLVIVSADRSPSQLDSVDERIRSRLSGGVMADLQPPSVEMRQAILEMKIRQIQNKHHDLVVPVDVVDFLARKLNSNVRALEGALNQVVCQGIFLDRPITLDMAQSVLRDLLAFEERKMTIDEIMKSTASHFDVTIGDLQSQRRHRSITRPRQIAMYLCKKLTTRSLPEIGRKFGGRDHTTVIHAVRRIDELMGKEPDIAKSVEQLRRVLEE